MATRDVERRALEDDRFYSDEIERLRLLLEASSTLLGSLSVDAMLPEILGLASRTLAADAYALWRKSSNDGTWSIAAADGLPQSYVDQATEAIRGQGDAILQEGPLIAEDIADATWISPAHREAHAAAGTRAMLVAGLRYADRLVGTLVFYYRRPRRFTEPEKNAASLLANLVAAAVGTAELYETQQRSAEDQRFVARASELLASSLDYERTLANVAALAVPQFANWCTIEMLGDDGSLKRLAVAHADPDKVRLAEELGDKYPPDPDAPYGVPKVIRTRRPELLSYITDELLEQATADTPELLEVLRELGLRSSMCVPIVARDRVLGAMTFVSAETGRRYDEDDLAIAQDLARRAGVAIDNARLFGATQSARREAQDSLAVVDAVFGAAPVGLAFMDRDFHYVRVNQALADINGLPADEHFGRSLRDVVGDDLAATIEPYHRQVLETGEPILELPIRGRTAAAPGELRNWLVSYYPVRDAADDVLGVGVVITDVTEREEARAAAEAARARLSVLAEASQQLAGTLDYETTLANLADLLVPRFADWYAVDVLAEGGRGFRRIAVVHRDPAKAQWAEKSQKLFAPEVDELEGTARVVRTGEAVLYRTISDELLAASTLGPEHQEVLRQLGMESAMCVPLTAAGRTFGALMLVSADPERLYDEDELEFAKHLGRRAAVAVDNARLYREAEQRARAAVVVEHVADGVLLVDNTGVIRLWNPAAEHITGVPARDAVGRPAHELFPGWARIDALAHTDELQPSAQAVAIDDRELWLSITGVSFDDGSVYAFRDLTEERAVEALKSDFVSTISHELRTPLAAIYGAALTLRREDIVLGEPQRTALLEVIASESDRLARIVNDVLWVSRLESGGLRTAIERCDLVELAQRVVDAARQYIPPDIKLEFSDGEPVAVFGDPDKIRQVLTNLVDNAVKYSPDGGRVSVDVSVAGENARVSVRDEGLGVPPAEHRRIFEKFYRLDPDLTRGVGGTGLGLFITRELLERMGGRIWVESSGHDGSTFVAELPLVT
ncbi:MAG: GAF domain-containing protein [Gaiellaceae bacterium]